MSLSIQLDSLEKKDLPMLSSSKNSNVKLSRLDPSMTLLKFGNFEKRFNSVKAREQFQPNITGKFRNTIMANKNKETDRSFNNSKILPDQSKEDKDILPTSWASLAEALPIALLKKKKTLEKKEEDDEVLIKKLIKIKNPKQYHGISLAHQELRTGIVEDSKKDPKIVHGKSYVISVSPSQRNYVTKKNLLLSNPSNLI